MSVYIWLPHHVAVSVYIICGGLCACTEMSQMCTLHVSFGFKVRPRTVGYVAICSAMLIILKYSSLVYSGGSVVHRVHVVSLDLV